nr:hypothetical protein [Tanacetum cinerariifolium]
AAETVRFIERVQLDDMDKCNRSLLLMREMEDKAREKSKFILKLSGYLQQTPMKVFLMFNMVRLRDQLLLLFTREVAEDTEKMENYLWLSSELRNGVRMRDRHIRKLQTSHMSDEVVKSIEILKRVQLDDMEKASRLLLMAREFQSKVFEKNIFIARLRD